ncbi:metallophosphoesterase family protein [Legionella rowbothamii]|uniref:metallophosphoesterase family protein n=1 Tax=Legionella rowbothamii TaxID=96229 RepID=UPI001056E1EC|nr:metallophosphoesterase [Legionella rowbothamii]
MNIAWLTDIHLNFLKVEARKKFYQQVIETGADQILITGDIAEAKDVCEILQEFSIYTNKLIYFVLGNHDYYFSSVNNVREKVRTLCAHNKNLIWLGEPKTLALADGIVLVGHDGWADARYGDFDHSLVNLNDSRLIAELYQAFLLNKSALKREMQKLADTDAAVLHETLCDAIDTDIKKVIIATHIPPFPESSWHKDKPSDENWLPYFASKATGDVIMKFVKKHADIQFLVLCGHTHTAVTIKLSDNLIIKSGHAEYYKSAIQEVFSL